MASDDISIASLSLNVKSSTASAEKGLDNLKETLNKLKNASSGKNLGLKGLKELSESLNKLKSSSTGLKLSSIASGITKIKTSLEDIGESTQALSNLADSVSKLGKAFKEMAPVSDALKTLSKNIKTPKSLRQTYEKYNETNTEQYYQPKAPVNAQPDTDIENTLRNKASSWGEIWSSLWDIAKTKTSEGVANITGKISNYFGDITGKISTLKTALSEMPNLSEKLKLSKDLENYKSELSNAMNTLESMGSAPFGKQFLALAPINSKIIDTTQKLEKLSQSSKTAEAVLSKLGVAFANAGKKALALGITIAKVPLNSLQRGFEGLKNVAMSAANSVHTFLTSLGRIAMYRTVRAVLKLIADGIREGTSNAYQFSKAFGGELSQNLDKVATSLLLVKNSIGAAVTPLINAFAPVIENITAKFVSFANIVNQSFAYLSGQEYWLKAKTYAVEYAEAANKATASNKKFGDQTSKSLKKVEESVKKATLGIDELNIIEKEKQKNKIPEPKSPKIDVQTPPKMDYTQMFEKVPIENKIKESLNDIKKYIENQDFVGLGTELGKKFNQAMDSIDFENFGSKIGDVINASVDTVYAFLTTADPFKKIGEKLGELLNGLFDKVNFEKLGRTVSNWFLGLPKFLVGLVSKLDFSKVTSKLSDFVIGIFDEQSNWLESTDWSTFGNNLGKNIWGGIKSVKYIEIAQSFGRLIWNVIKTAFILLPSISGGLFESIVSDTVKKLFGIDLSEEVKETINSAAKMIGGALASGIVSGITFGPLVALLGSALGGLLTMVLDFFGIHSPSTVMAEKVGKPIAEGIVRGISSTITSLKDTIIGIGETILNWVGGKVGRFFDKGKEMCNRLGNGISKTYTNIKGTVETWANSIKNWFTGGEGQNNIANQFGSYAKLITGKFEREMRQNYSKTREPIKDWSNKTSMWFLENDLYRRFENAGVGIINDFKHGVENGMSTTKTYMKDSAEAVYAPFGNLPSSFRNSGVESFNGYMGGFNSKLQEGMEILKKSGPMLFNAWCKGLKIQSPSRLFMQAGEYTIEGYNIGIKNKISETEDMLENFSSSLTKNLKANVEIDTDYIKNYAKSYTDTVSAELNGTSRVSVSGFEENVREFYKDEILPLITQIASDTRRQADKDEKTVVNIGNKTIEESVNTQRRANGYRFLVEA